LRGIKVQSAGRGRKLARLNVVKNQEQTADLYLVLTVFAFSKTTKL